MADEQQSAIDYFDNPTEGDPRERRGAWLLAPFVSIAMLLCLVLALSALPSTLVIEEVGSDSRSRLRADYRPWNYAYLDIDFAGLATSAAAGDGQAWANVADAPPELAATLANQPAQVAEALPTATLAGFAPFEPVAAVSPTAAPPGAAATLTSTPSTQIIPPLPSVTAGSALTPSSTPVPTATGPKADLAISNTDGLSNVDQGDPVSYIVSVSNAGPQAANGAALSVTFSGNLSGVTWSCTASGGAACGTASGTGNISASVNLTSGGSLIYTVNATVQAAATGSISSVASISAPTGITDPASGNNSAVDTTPINASGTNADLEVFSISDGMSIVSQSQALTYTVVVKNNGPVTASAATISDNAPSRLTAGSWSCTPSGGATCGAASGTGFLNTTGTLPSGGRLTYTVTATVGASATGSITYTATINPPGGITDPSPGNNSASDIDSIVLTPTANLAAGLSSIFLVVNPNDAVSYTLTFDNLGPDDVTGASFVSLAPAESELNSMTWTCSASGGASCGAASGSGTLPGGNDLPAGGGLTYQISGTVPGTARGSIDISYRIDPPGGVSDPTTANNTASISTPIEQISDFALINLAANKASLLPGEAVSFTFQVRNLGPDNNYASAPVRVQDNSPVDLINITWSCAATPPGSCPASGSGFPNTLVSPAPGGVLNFTVNAQVVASPGGASITYAPSLTIVASDADDWNLPNNSASVNVPILSGLVVNRIDDDDDSNPGDGACWDGTGCSLRAAVQEANALGGNPTITFNIPGAGVHTISSDSGIPAITTAMTIDATTQPGYSGTPLIEVQGTGLVTNGFTVNAAATLRGLSISRYDLSLIAVNAASTVIEDNYIGVAPSGTTGFSDNGNGILITTGNVTIRNNVIASTGVDVFVTGGSGSVIESNYIGLKADGNSAINSTSIAVQISNASSQNNTIQNNFIGGCSWDAIYINAGANNNSIQGNRIGTNAAGTTSVSCRNGIHLQSVSGTQILNNLISGNRDAGIWLETATSTTVDGNIIGLNAAGNGALGNGLSGIAATSGADFNMVTNNTLSSNGNDGLTIVESINTDAVGNRIGLNSSGGGSFGNGRAGIAVTGSTSKNNTFSMNLIANNTGLGIDLGLDGVTANDPGDVDAGPNDLENKPVITNVDTAGVVSGTINGAASRNFRLEFYRSNSFDAEGQVYLGFTTVTTDTAGNANWTMNLGGLLTTGDWVTAIAINQLTTSTSEFSNAFQFIL